MINIFIYISDIFWWSGNIIIWVGIVDQFEEGVWQDPSPPNPHLQFDGFWETGQPNGGTLENCVRTYIDRRWRDQSCDERLVDISKLCHSKRTISSFCAVCEFPTRMNLTMRGLCASGILYWSVSSCHWLDTSRYKTDGGIFWHRVFHRGIQELETSLERAGQESYFLHHQEKSLEAWVILCYWEGTLYARSLILFYFENISVCRPCRRWHGPWCLLSTG